MSEGDRDRRVYAPPPEDSYDARDSGRRGLVLLVVSVVVLFAAAAMAWSTYNLGLREGGREAPPRIVADSGPFRTEPEDPGGFQAPDQDIEVYDTLSGAARDTAERFAPPPEAPLEEAVAAQPAPQPVPEERGIQIVEADPGAADDAGAPVNLQPQPQEPAAAPENGIAGVLAGAEAAIQGAARPQTPPPAAAAGGGAWLVQIAALRSEEEAIATWNRVAAANASMSGMARDIQRADLGERGIYYRLRAAGFATKASAESFCSGLQQSGQDCIVVER